MTTKEKWPLEEGDSCRKCGGPLQWKDIPFMPALQKLACDDCGLQNSLRNRPRSDSEGVESPESGTVDELGDGFADATDQWRFDELVHAGFLEGEAAVLASHHEVDLHEAAALLEHGCPAETALRILL